MGTAGYMAPEQARGMRLDKRADIWAFGMVFFEMLAGKLAFEGHTVADQLASVLKRSRLEYSASGHASLCALSSAALPGAGTANAAITISPKCASISTPMRSMLSWAVVGMLANHGPSDANQVTLL